MPANREFKKTPTSSRIAAFKSRTRAAREKGIMASRQRSIIPRAPAAFIQTGSEIKAVDIAEANYAFRNIAGTPTNQLLNGIQTGAGFFNRVGSRIEMKSLHIRGYISNVATGLQSQLRMVVVYDRQPNGATPTIQTILNTRIQTGVASTTGTSEINLDNRDRFVIVRDYTVYAPAVTNTAGVLTNGPAFPGDDEQFDVNLFIKLKGLATHYSASSNPTTIADISTGALYCLFIDAVGNAIWQFSGSFRLRYDDK